MNVKRLVGKLCALAFGGISVLSSHAQTNTPGAMAHFDGAGAYGMVEGFGASAPTNDITIEFWQKVSATQDQASISLCTDADTNSILIIVPASDGKVYWGLGDTNGGGLLSYTPPASIVGTWQHFAFVANKTGNSMSIYRNGVLEAQKSGMTPFSRASFPLIIGALLGGPAYYQGDIDEVRVWSSVRSANQISGNMNKILTGGEGNLAAYWRFDDGGGESFMDSSGHGLAGVLTNGAALVVSAAPIGLPVVVTLPVSSLTQTSAVFNGTITPNFQLTGAYFQYGTSTAYGKTTPVVPLAADGSIAMPLSGVPTGLVTGTLYHYRLTATNSAGTNSGVDLTFTPNYFTPLSGTGLIPLVLGSSAWADYDGDGFYDLLVSGNNNGGVGLVAQVYHNNGNNTFSSIGLGTTPVYKSSVVWGDLDNDGKVDFITAGQASTLNPTIEVWRNLGNGSFVRTNTMLSGIRDGALALGDYDNDGRLDVLLGGSDINNVRICQLWHNDGNFGFSIVAIPLPGFSLGSLAWGDYDSDGKLDILISGYDGANPTTQVWRNLGGGAFANINAGITGAYYSSVAWGDYDNDGKVDVLLTGYDGTKQVSQIWHNTGGGVFTNLMIGLTNLYQGSAIWGDFDNDGRQDVVITGADSGNKGNALVLKNLGNGGFTNTQAGLTGVNQSVAAFGDVDGDGNLDLLTAGTSTGGTITQVLLNNSPKTNAVPSAPTGLSAVPTSTGVLLSWNASTDDTTPSPGLTYNIRVGKTPGGSEVMSAMSDPVTGHGYLLQPGNAQERLSQPLNIPLGAYYWTVQAVDASFAGSPFATEASFVLAALVTTEPASDLTFTSATLNGTVNPRGVPVLAWFEWGISQSYGSTTTPQNLGNGTNFVGLSQTLPLLLPGVTYDFRAVASNQFGIKYGGNRTFITQLNSPPQVSSFTNLSIPVSSATPPIPFTVSDAETPPNALQVMASASDSTLIPAGNIVLGGSGNNRTLTITPVAGLSGSSAISVVVSDGLTSTSRSFILNVGMFSSGIPGDVNGDGIVDQNELNGVLSNYWGHSPWLMMTNPASLGNGRFQFALTNASGWDFSVQFSTNLTDWEVLPNPAIPVYQFIDPSAAAGAPMRYYRLRYP